MRIVRFAFLLFALVAATVVRAQSVHWENGDSTMGTVIQLVFEDCQPDGDPQLPSLPNATLVFSGRTENMNMVNFNVSRTVTLSYFVQARRSGPLQIPEFTVKTDKGALRVPAYNGSAAAVSTDSVASSKLIPERTTVWAGEVFGLTYELTAARRNAPQINPTFDWNPSPLVAEDWSKYEVTEPVVNGQRQLQVTFHTRAYAKTPNTIKLEAASHLLQVQTGSASFGLFSQPRMEPVSVTSDQPTIEVRPLPAPPSTFTGAVGQFKLTSKVVPTEAGIGEPVTWTLELSGTGNWPDIAGLPSREVSKDFQVVQPKAKRTPVDGKLFDVTLSEDVVLIPTKAGTYAISPVSFTFFNPRTGSYETIRTERTTVKIAPPAATQLGFSAPAQGDSATNPAEETSKNKQASLKAPPAPAGIPRDPLAGLGEAITPMSTRALVCWMAAPFAAVLILWIALAGRRAARTDPLRSQREARARLATLLAVMKARGANAAKSDAELLQWQRDTAVLFRIRHAAPSAEAIENVRGLTKTAGDTGAQMTEWARLWREVDRMLYSTNTALPPDWVARAEAALAAKQVPGFNPARLLLPQNLLAFAAVIAAVLMIPISSLGAATPSPEAAYRAGDFGAAEKMWRDAVADRPTDWIARHNLSLALSQQDHPGEAAAEAAAAFVQHPNHPSVYWHFSLTSEQAGFAPAPLLPLLKEGPLTAVATLASPAVWQRILVGTAFVIAAMLCWMLVNAYGRRARGQFWAAAMVGTAALLLALVSSVGFVAYGNTADIRAVVTWQPGTLRSIPTEADTTQKTTSLAAGSVAIVNKTFLEWDRLVFPNGQTGWVRKEQVVPLWR